MLLLIALLLLASLAGIATVIELRRDGYHRTPTDWSRISGRDVPQHVKARRVSH